MNDVHVDVEALYAALDAQRRSRSLSWRQLAAESGVSPSTLTRMAQGRRPDVDGFAALVHWLGLPAEQFVRGTGGGGAQPEPMAAISSLLRARRDLTPASAAALEDIIRAAYDRLRDPEKLTGRGARRDARASRARVRSDGDKRGGASRRLPR